MNAVPEAPERAPGKPSAKLPPPVSRRDAFKRRGAEVQMPPIQWGGYILDYLFEVGPTMPSGMGSGPLTFSEIEAWQRAVGIRLSPFEAQLLRRLSVEYFGESHSATKADSPPPYGVSLRLVEVSQKEINRKLDQFFG